MTEPDDHTTMQAPGVVELDLDGDGGTDAMGLDTTGDGVLDAVVVPTTTGYRVYTDTDADGSLDTVAEDVDGDGVPETVETVLPGPGDPTLDDPTDPGSAPAADPYAFDPGWVDSLPPDAAREAYWWQQQTENGFCGPTSVAMVVSEFLGAPVDAGVFVHTATALGLLEGQPGDWSGMRIDQIDDLLEAFGVPSHEEMFDGPSAAEAGLQSALDGRHGIIALVDSSEVWDGVDDDGAATDAGPDHAVVVVDMDDQYVYLNDPGTPDGQASAVPKAEFFDAWDDSGYAALVTDLAPGDELVTGYADPDLVVHGDSVLDAGTPAAGAGGTPSAPDASTGDDPTLVDPTRQVDLAVQPAIPFDPGIAASGKALWLLPIVGPAAWLGVRALR